MYLTSDMSVLTDSARAFKSCIHRNLAEISSKTVLLFSSWESLNPSVADHIMRSVTHISFRPLSRIPSVSHEGAGLVGLVDLVELVDLGAGGQVQWP